MAAATLPVIYRTIKDAQIYDEQGNEVEAYRYYLASAQHITAVLLSASPTVGGTISPELSRRLFHMATQCLERAESMFIKAEEEGRELTAAGTAPREPRRHSKSVDTARPRRSRPQDGSPLTASAQHFAAGSQTLPMTVQSANSAGSLNSSPRTTYSGRHHSSSSLPRSFDGAVTSGVQSLHRISPMDEARRKNQHLMAQYQAHLKKQSSNVFKDQHQNISLNYLRRLEENMSVARINQQALTRKMREREARLQESAQRQRYKSFDSLSWEELMEEVTSFEQGKANLAGVKQKLADSPSSSNALSLINEVLGHSEHPLSRLFYECQFATLSLLTSIARNIEKTGTLPRVKVHKVKNAQVSPTSVANGHICQPPHSDSSQPPSSTSSTSVTDPLQEQVPVIPPQKLSDELPALPPPTENLLEQRLAQLKDSLFESDSSPPSVRKVNTSGTKERLGVVQRSDEGVFSDEDGVDFNPMSGGRTASSPSNSTVENLREEEEEEAVFRALPVVSCSFHLGNEEALQKLSKTAEDHLLGTIKLIHSGLDKTWSAFTRAYPQLDTEENMEVCYTLLEANFFPNLMPMLIPVYRCSKYASEVAVTKHMATHVNCSPKEFHVRKRFWLHDQDSLPYSKAIEHLKKLPTLLHPTPKLQCLVSLSRLIVECIKDYYVEHGAERESVDTAIGVDDMLPILTYIIIRTALPQLVSECALMEDFIHESFAMGEEGFCLTTFRTALQYICRMSSSEREHVH